MLKREREGGKKEGKGKKRRERESFKKLAKVAISDGVPG
jgi:hypothetical protein